MNQLNWKDIHPKHKEPKWFSNVVDALEKTLERHIAAVKEAETKNGGNFSRRDYKATCMVIKSWGNGIEFHVAIEYRGSITVVKLTWNIAPDGRMVSQEELICDWTADGGKFVKKHKKQFWIVLYPEPLPPMIPMDF